jgi:prepilin-type N-terminal cleavage/methylation domain-containing protein
MLLRRGIPAGDRGFTLVEVMVAVALLLVGVLGTVTMITGANAQTAVTKNREGAVNLAREIVDAARGVDYDSLTPTAIVPAIQSQPALGDSDGAAGWQISRRGETYTVSSLPVCVVDAPADGLGAHPTPADPAAPGYCSGQTAGTADANADDFRRMDVTLTWSTGGRSYSLRDTTLIINPSGGIGPTVKSLCRVAGANDPTCPVTALSGVVTSGTAANFLALTSPADTSTWTVDDGSEPVDVNTSNPSAPAGTGWNFSWNIGTPVESKVPATSYTCGMAVDWTLDGNYIVSAQAISGIGANAVPGQLKPYTATINRSEPYKVCGMAGGYDGRHGASASHVDAVDLEWKANAERDIVGYRVYRVNGDGSSNLICDTTSITNYPSVSTGCTCTSQNACLDTSPKNTNSVVTYRVTALDRRSSDNSLRETTVATQTALAVDQGNNNPPGAIPAGGLTEVISGGLPVLSWPASTDPDGDSILYYRIYRNGTAYKDRYDRVDGNKLSWSDPDPSPGGDTYWVTAVDSHWSESDPTQAVAG